MAKRRAKGDGAIYFSESKGLFIGQIDVGFDEYGKRKRKTVYGKTKTEVQEKLKSVEYQIFSGTFTNPSTITIYHLAKQILDDKLNQGEFKETSYFRNIETLKQTKAIYNTPLQSGTETQLKSFLLKCADYSQSTLDKIFRLLNMTFAEAEKRNIISNNPMKHIKKPKSRQEKKKVRALTKDEQRKLTALLLSEDIPYSRQMLLSLLTGMRMGEVNALDIKSVNFNFNVIMVKRTMTRGQKGEAILGSTAKTSAGIRKIPMTTAVKELMIDCIKDRKSGLVFTHNDKLITTSQVNLQFQRIIKKYNILDDTVDGRVDLHSLRHTYVTRCIEGGMSFKALQELMGHTDIRITMNTYCDATNDFINDNMRKVDEYMQSVGLNLAIV